MAVDAVLEGIRRGTRRGLILARKRLAAWSDVGVQDADRMVFDTLDEMVREFLTRESPRGTPCVVCGPGATPPSPRESTMEPLCLACLRRLRQACASCGGRLFADFDGVGLEARVGAPLYGMYGEWAYHATLSEWLPSVARVGLVPRRQPRERAGERRGIGQAGVFFCCDEDNALVWNDAVLRFPWPEMWGRDPYGEGQNLWTDRWIPPEVLEAKCGGTWVPIAGRESK